MLYICIWKLGTWTDIEIKTIANILICYARWRRFPVLTGTTSGFDWYSPSIIVHCITLDLDNRLLVATNVNIAGFSVTGSQYTIQALMPPIHQLNKVFKGLYKYFLFSHSNHNEKKTIQIDIHWRHFAYSHPSCINI